MYKSKNQCGGYYQNPAWTLNRAVCSMLFHIFWIYLVNVGVYYFHPKLLYLTGILRPAKKVRKKSRPICVPVHHKVTSLKSIQMSIFFFLTYIVCIHHTSLHSPNVLVINLINDFEKI